MNAARKTIKRWTDESIMGTGYMAAAVVGLLLREPMGSIACLIMANMWFVADRIIQKGLK